MGRARKGKNCQSGRNKSAPYDREAALEKIFREIAAPVLTEERYNELRARILVDCDVAPLGSSTEEGTIVVRCWGAAWGPHFFYFPPAYVTETTELVRPCALFTS